MGPRTPEFLRPCRVRAELEDLRLAALERRVEEDRPAVRPESGVEDGLPLEGAQRERRGRDRAFARDPSTERDAQRKRRGEARDDDRGTQPAAPGLGGGDRARA